MGASGWFYTTPYDSDIQAALDRLCDEVFRNGEYHMCWEPGPFSGDMSREQLVESTIQSVTEWFEFADESLTDAGSIDDIAGIHESIERLRAGGQPTTIDAVLMLSGESGTHSILDCPNYAETETFSCVSPLTPQEYERFFHTQHPTLADVEAGDLYETCDRWFGKVVVCYGDDRAPASLAFIGVSGD